MGRFICRQNIRNLRRRLEMTEDERERETLLRLLAEEETKLKELTAPGGSLELCGSKPPTGS